MESDTFSRQLLFSKTTTFLKPCCTDCFRFLRLQTCFLHCRAEVSCASRLRADLNSAGQRGLEGWVAWVFLTSKKLKATYRCHDNKLILFALLGQWEDKEHDGQEECHMWERYEADTKGEGNYAPRSLTPFITAGPRASGWFCFTEQAERFIPPFKSVFFQGTSVSNKYLLKWH